MFTSSLMGQLNYWAITGWSFLEFPEAYVGGPRKASASRGTWFICHYYQEKLQPLPCCSVALPLHRLHLLFSIATTLHVEERKNLLFLRYKHFYAKDESTHPSMVSTHQHIFKGKMCKNVETVSTHVKSVSTRVAVFQKSSLPRSTHSQSRSTLDPVSRTASLKNWVDTGSSSQNSLLHILDSASTLPLGQVDTLRKLFILKVDGYHVSL
ncbi:hypothetical protein Taro_042628 [Colocasia esculenta]|uniref:Uncharacterized protein n=1 Tax=Colocasia esculenta TaxID=4460 RepID=A0A843WX03_COLES|nr:hypothetical protein [Colocasia esculenta]